jgi:hypothetical protein
MGKEPEEEPPKRPKEEETKDGWADEEEEEEEEPEPVTKEKDKLKKGKKGELTVKDLVIKGAIHFRNDDYSEAIIEWQKALEIEPDHPEIIDSIKEAMAKLKEKK